MMLISCPFIPQHPWNPRCMNFSNAGMDEDRGLGFREICRVVAGFTGDANDSILSSLASELCFNDLRDSGRRHMKAEKTCPQNIHAVAHKSSTSRPGGGKSLALSSSDWQATLSQKYVKARVHSTLKATDLELGVSSEGLTKHKTSKNFTKPHILAQRLDLLRLLRDNYHAQIRPQLNRQEDRQEVLLSTYKELWTSKLIPEHCFVAWDEGKASDTRELVLSAGPHSVRVLPLVKFEQGVYTFQVADVPRTGKIVGDMISVVIAFTEPCLAHDQLGWKQTSEWMSLAEYIAEHSIYWIPKGLLASVCTALGLKHSKMDFKARVRLFLNHQGKSDDFITSVLEELPDDAPHRTRKKDPEESTTEILYNQPL